jgi:hypothetical protein
VGYADLCKGFDVFMRVVACLAADSGDVSFAWLGCEMPMLRHWALHVARLLGFADRLFLLPRVRDVHEYYAVSDLLLLTSREDPFPSVVLEALSHGVPAVAFEGATGSVELLRRGCGSTVPYADDRAMADEALRLLRDGAAREAMGRRGRSIVATEFQWRDYVYDLLAEIGERRPRVSVVVELQLRLALPRRLESIFGQTTSARGDRPRRRLHRRERRGRGSGCAPNEAGAGSTPDANSGSVFEQWRRARKARVTLVWIAEADDSRYGGLSSYPLPCRPRGGHGLRPVPPVDEEIACSPSILDYVKDVDAAKWRRSWVRDARDELRESFVVKNTIPNVSAVLFRREPLRRVLEDELDFIRGFRIAGDYACYVRLLAGGGKIAFVSEALNNHRRHDRSVTLKGFGASLVAEIARVQTAVFDSVGSTPEAAAKAERYLGVLSRQFQLVPDGRHWGHHPALSDLASHSLYASSAGGPEIEGAP